MANISKNTQLISWISGQSPEERKRLMALDPMTRMAEHDAYLASLAPKAVDAPKRGFVDAGYLMRNADGSVETFTLRKFRSGSKGRVSLNSTKLSLTPEEIQGIKRFEAEEGDLYVRAALSGAKLYKTVLVADGETRLDSEDSDDGIVVDA